jgi:hypothetical protein
MDLKDATLMFLVEAADYPAAFEAIIGPVLQEIGRRKPIQSGRGYTWQPGQDPLTAGL